MPGDFEHVGGISHVEEIPPSVEKSTSDDVPPLPDLTEPKFVLVHTETNASGGLDVVVPWLPERFFRSGEKRDPTIVAEEKWKRALTQTSRRAFRVLSAAMVANYYLSKDPTLAMASIGAQVQQLCFPVFTAYTFGEFIAPFGVVMYVLAKLKVLS